MNKKKLPPEILEWFREQEAKGGKLGGSAGGKASAAKLTKKERVARAKEASIAAVVARKAKGRKNSSVQEIV
jgi:hypothetical protein